MIHARQDYQRIQDPWGKIGGDEPVFLVRAKDMCAPGTVIAWAYLAEAAGADPDIIKAAHEQAVVMRLWQEKHGKKIPDMPAE